MAAVSSEDDFQDRAVKSLKEKFQQSLIPSHVLPYLRCLTKIEEERVQAKENSHGATLAAAEMFDFIVRHSHWTEDLKRAFRNPEVKLEFLADEIDNFLREVPMRWDIIGFVDNNGTACFDGNCTAVQPAEIDDSIQHGDRHGTDTRSVSEVHVPDQQMKCLKEDETLPKRNRSSADSALSAIPVPDQQMQWLKGETSTNRSFAGLTQSPTETLVDARADIEIKRENLRLKILGDIWSYVRNLDDIPVVLDYMKSANLHISSIEKGSLLFKIRVNTLEDLDSLQKLVMYGGMKTILDQELIEKHMKDFQGLAKTEGLELLNIKSKLYVHEPDLERCKCTLLSALRDQKYGLESIQELPTENFRNETDILLFKYLKEVFPPICIKMMNDPFLKPRMSEFLCYAQGSRKSLIETSLESFESDIGLNLFAPVSYQKELLKIIPNRSEKKSVVLFFDWFQKEVIKYFESLSSADVWSLPKLMYSHLPLDRFINPIVQYILSPSTLPMDSSDLFKTIQSIIVKKRRGPYPTSVPFKLRPPHMFELSALLLDTLLTYMLDVGSFAQDLVSDILKMNKSEFLPLTVNLFCSGDTKQKLQSVEFLENTLNKMDLNKLVKRSKISVDKSLLDMKFHDIKLIAFFQFVTSDEILIKLLKQNNVETMSDMEVSLTIDGLELSKVKSALQSLSKFLAVSRITTGLNINRCERLPADFSCYLQTAILANLKKLSLIETEIILQTSNDIGLKYLPRLQSLDLQGCNLGDTGITAVCRELAHLQELRDINIANNDMSSEGLLELSNSLINNHRITAIRIQNNKIGIEGAIVLAGLLRRLFLLDTLNINGCEVGNLGMKYISASIVSKVIRQLTMRENNVTKEGSTTFFQNMKNKTRLEHLDFGRNKVFDEVYLTVTEKASRTYPETEAENVTAFLYQKAHWAHISMWSCNLGAYRIFRSPEKLSALKDLIHLCLQSNQIDDSFAEDVGACLKEHCKHIRHVNLRHNQIGNVGAKGIADGIAGKRYLEELLMDKNQIEEDGIRSLLTVALSMTHSLQLNVTCNNLAKLDIDMIASELSMKRLESRKEQTTVYKSSDEKLKIEIYM